MGHIGAKGQKSMNTTIVNCREAATYLGVSVKTIRRWAQAGKLQGKKVGTRGDWRFAYTDLDKMVHSTGAFAAHVNEIADYLQKNIEKISQQICESHRVDYAISDERWRVIKRNQPLYVSVIAFFIEFLTNQETAKHDAERHSRKIAELSLKNGLTIEEITDGVIVLKRTLLDNLYECGLSSRMKIDDLFVLMTKITEYGDILSSQISFAYHYEYERSRNGLAQSEEKFAKVFHSGPVAFSISRYSDGKYVDVNDRFLKLVGYSREEIIGSNPLELNLHVEENATKSYYNRRSQLRKTGHLPVYYVTYKTKSGEYKRIRSASVLVKIGDEEHTVTMQTNITNLLKAREGRLKYVELSTAHDALLELTKAKDQFIGIASHQLRTPATAVKQYIGILLAGMSGELTDEQKKYLETAYNSNERQLKLINDLLKTAQIDADAYTLHRSQQNIATLVSKSATAIAPTIERRNQQLVFVDKSKGTSAFVDPIEMDLVFSNLLDNASKYSHEKSIVTVTICRSDTAIEVHIADQGVGIDAADQVKIFDKFTRVTNELSLPNNGSGLGLYWVKNIVNMHGGTINLQSRLGNGATFIVRLPL